MLTAEQLNADAQTARLSLSGLHRLLKAQGEAWYDLVTTRCPHLFAEVALFITPAQLQQMTEVIAAVERIVASGEWGVASEKGAAVGVFYGYDFHLNASGAQLIEINTNAGGAFLNALLSDSQREANLPGEAVAASDLEQVFLEMFCNEWRLQRGDAKLVCVAIVDEQPDAQYLYPEFLLVQRLFERAGIRALIVDPADFLAREQGLYVGEQRVDLIYNRLTDFSLQQYPALRDAYLANRVVLTPNPAHYARYADKRNLARLTDVATLQQLGASEADIVTLQAGIPHTFVVRPEREENLWLNRKCLFFKPNNGFGSRGAYRGDKLTRRVFGEILQSDYVAQTLAQPGERCVAEDVALKYDVRCYVYDGQIQLLAARLYQGQTTNFRTPGGGFAPVRVVGS